MTTTQTTTKEAGKGAQAGQYANGDVASKRVSREIQLPTDASGFVKMPDDGMRYSPEECNKLPLQGFLVGAVRRVSPDNGPFISLIMHTTAKTLAVDIDGNVIDVEPGSRVEIVATAKLQGYIRYATHPQKVFEVRIQPTKPKKIGAGRSLWMYDIGLHPDAVKRPAFYPAPTLAQLSGAAEGAPQLAAGASGSDTDIPF